jgi:hypothetical protein
MIATTEYVQAPPHNLVDPRVAKHGGTRRNAKANYQFPGQMDQASWRRTEVHANTSYYGCGICGHGFAAPAAVYCHLAKRHDR